MDYYAEPDDWTLVNYRGGRLQPRRSQPHTTHWREDQYPRRYREPQVSRPTYVSIARGNQRYDREHSSRSSYHHGSSQRSSASPLASASQPSRRYATTGGLENQRQSRQQPTRGQIAPCDTRAQVRVASDDPDFTQKVRVVYRVIKAAHHLKNVSGPDTPPMIAKTTHSLATLIKPASPNDATQLLLEGNARNWEHTALLVLQDHYEQSMSKGVRELAQFPDQNWKGPFEVATVWATKNLGRRLRPDTLQNTEAFLVANLTCQQQPTGTLPASAQSVATMTDQRGGDWPPFPLAEDEPVAPLPPSPPPVSPLHPPSLFPPPPPLSPLLPRSRRRREDNGQRSQTAEVTAAEQPTKEQTITSTTTSGPGSTTSASKGSSILPLPPLPTPEPTRSEKAGSAALREATTPRGKLQQPRSGAPPVTPPHRPTRHGNTDKKNKRDWVLCVRGEHLIMGDSNVSRIPPFQRGDLQVDSFPGATFHHAEAILRRSKTSRLVKSVILSFGLNNRDQKPRETTIKQLQGAVRAATARFPQARILVPEVNIPRSLTLKQRMNLRVVNDHIRKDCDFIPHLSTTDFETESNSVRWSRHTASRMLERWVYHLYTRGLIEI